MPAPGGLGGAIGSGASNASTNGFGNEMDSLSLFKAVITTNP